jgi:hypothetical protein
MQRAVAIVGDSNGYTGAASVTFSGLSAVPWLQGNGSVNVVVQRIPDQSPLTAPQTVLSQAMSAAGGSVTVPLTFQAAHDAFAIYPTPSGGVPPGYHKLVIGNDGLCADVSGNSAPAGPFANAGNGARRTPSSLDFRAALTAFLLALTLTEVR